ncbi:MAG: cupin [Pseudomonadota bacterium]
MTSPNVETILVEPNGYVPNHPTYPFLIYRQAWRGGDSPQNVLAHFAGNGWHGGWVNGVFPFHHYHAQSHEVLANLGAPIDVQFGGPAGQVVEFGTGDIVLIPAGGGHCLVGSASASGIVGAYPAGQEDWDLKRDQPDDYQLALNQIPNVPLPLTDPFTGTRDPLLDHWQAA